jgi:pyridoxal biosynthesis lyase PdxS
MHFLNVALAKVRIGFVAFHEFIEDLGVDRHQEMGTFFPTGFHILRRWFDPHWICPMIIRRERKSASVEGVPCSGNTILVEGVRARDTILS